MACHRVVSYRIVESAAGLKEEIVAVVVWLPLPLPLPLRISGKCSVMLRLESGVAE
jgi:hypothetical protein